MDNVLLILLLGGLGYYAYTTMSTNGGIMNQFFKMGSPLRNFNF